MTSRCFSRFRDATRWRAPYNEEGRLKAAGISARRRRKYSLTPSSLRGKNDRCLTAISSELATSRKAPSVRSSTSYYTGRELVPAIWTRRLAASSTPLPRPEPPPSAAEEFRCIARKNLGSSPVPVPSSAQPTAPSPPHRLIDRHNPLRCRRLAQPYEHLPSVYFTALSPRQPRLLQPIDRRSNRPRGQPRQPRQGYKVE
jgi:hypothetical protein